MNKDKIGKLPLNSSVKFIEPSDGMIYIIRSVIEQNYKILEMNQMLINTYLEPPMYIESK